MRRRTISGRRIPFLYYHHMSCSIVELLKLEFPASLTPRLCLVDLSMMLAFSAGRIEVGE